MTPSEPASESEGAPTRSVLWGRLAVFAAGVEFVLALLAWVLSVSKNEGLCPGGASFSCATLFRERIGVIGPLHLSQIAPLGAALTLLALVGLRVYPPQARTLRRLALALPASGAGLALSAQALALSASAALCAVCLALACAALAAAALAAASLRREERLLLGVVFALALALGGASALGRGLWLRADDRERSARLDALHGEAGPRLLLVTRSGCSFCKTFKLDLLGDPSVGDLLAKTRGLEEIPESDPRARTHADGPGAPVLIALNAAGESLGRLRGVPSAAELRAFLVEATRPGN